MNQQIFMSALDLYVNWLNSLPDTIPPYTTKDFTDYPYRELSCVESYNADITMHVCITDGGEGGPTDLIFTWNERDNSIGFILQGFDTMWKMIYNDGEFIPLD